MKTLRNLLNTISFKVKNISMIYNIESESFGVQNKDLRAPP